MKTKPCPTCGGTGYDPAEQFAADEAPEDPCPNCDGAGTVPRRRALGWDVFDPATGTVVVHVRFEWLARYLTNRSAWRAGSLDYRRPGGRTPTGR